MKLFHKKFFWIVSVVSLSFVGSCNSTNNPVWDQAIPKIAYSGQVLGYETHLLHQTTTQKIRRGASQYQPLTLKKQFICQSQLELQHSLDDMINQSTYQKIDGQNFLDHLGHTQQAYLDSILSLWQKGGIKGTIFSDITKLPSQKIHLADLFTPIHSILKDSTLILSHFANNNTEVIRYYLHISAHAYQLVSYALIQYLYRQVGFLCDFYPLRPKIRAQFSHSIYQNQPITNAIALTKRVFNQNFTLQSNTKLIAPYPTRLNYQALPTSLGQKQDTIQIEFLIPRLHDTIRHQVTKIIHYEVIP